MDNEIDLYNKIDELETIIEEQEQTIEGLKKENISHYNLENNGRTIVFMIDTESIMREDEEMQKRMIITSAMRSFSEFKSELYNITPRQTTPIFIDKTYHFNPYYDNSKVNP